MFVYGVRTSTVVKSSRHLIISSTISSSYGILLLFALPLRALGSRVATGVGVRSGGKFSYLGTSM